MPVTKKTVTRRSAKQAAAITPEDRQKMIETAAYYLAEQRGFQGGGQMHDWLEAESRIERMYGSAKPGG